MNSTKARYGQADFKKPKRKLGHAQSITEGGNFTAKPNFLEDLLLDGKIDVAYYRLITVMLRHADTFHIKESYLRKRFSPKGLQRLKARLVEDGIVVWEKVGGKNIYHTNPVHMWKLDGAQKYASDSEPDDSSSEPDEPEIDKSGQNVERSPGNTFHREHVPQGTRSTGNAHKKTKAKKLKGKKTIFKDISASSEKRRDSKSKSNITKKRLIGEYRSCFKYGKRA